MLHQIFKSSYFISNLIKNNTDSNDQKEQSKDGSSQKSVEKIQFIHKCKYIHNFTCTFDTLVHLISDTFTTDVYLIT